mmetsp:Transcript_4152/g.16114  ORF Transcript_4152/g.16114 Transcript_4152/m.16114 type:complete len:208 (-) Transcript_4152:4818-5441(-)
MPLSRAKRWPSTCGRSSWQTCRTFPKDRSSETPASHRSRSASTSWSTPIGTFTAPGSSIVPPWLTLGSCSSGSASRMPCRTRGCPEEQAPRATRRPKRSCRASRASSPSRKERSPVRSLARLTPMRTWGQTRTAPQSHQSAPLTWAGAKEAGRSSSPASKATTRQRALIRRQRRRLARRWRMATRAGCPCPSAPGSTMSCSAPTSSA